MKSFFSKSLRYSHFVTIFIVAIVTILTTVKIGADKGVIVSISGVFIALLGEKILDITEASFKNKKDADIVSRLLRQEIRMYRSRIGISMQRWGGFYKIQAGFSEGKDFYANKFFKEIKSNFNRITFPMYNAVIENGMFFKIPFDQQDNFFDAKVNIEIITTKVHEISDTASYQNAEDLVVHMKAILREIDKKVP